MDEQCEHIALTLALAAKAKLSPVEFRTFAGMCCSTVADGYIAVLDRHAPIGQMWKLLLRECAAFDGNVDPVLCRDGVLLVYMNDDGTESIDAASFVGDERYPGLAMAKALLYMWGWNE